LDLGGQEWGPLYPFIVTMTCSHCKAKETYFIDLWDPRRDTARMKSFERGHTMNNTSVSEALTKWNGMFDGRFEDRRHAIEVFERWNEEVKERVPPDKLLVYEVQEGWVPLCEFLGVGVPKDKPFPHLNDAESFQKMIRRRLALTVAVPTVALSLTALALLHS
jgi:hypothetical protein